MVNELRYNGYSANPSDYECQDGDMALSINMIPEDGALRIVKQPKVVMNLNDKKVVYIHAVSVFENYIIYDETAQKLSWVSSDNIEDAAKNLIYITGKELYQVTAMGNTLVILTSSGIIYALYKLNNYRIMGGKPVFPSISFRLRTSNRLVGSTKVTFEKFTPIKSPGSDGFSLSTKACEALKNSVLALFNPHMAKQKSEGDFIYPFMLRYAYRMMDGTLGYISQPIKMYVSNGIPISIKHKTTYYDLKFIEAFDIELYCLESRLYYEISNIEEVKQSLSEWKELVKSIDIFVSPAMEFIDEESIGRGIVVSGGVYSIHHECCESKFQGHCGAEESNGKYIYRIHETKSLFSNENEFFYVSNKTSIEDNDPMNFYLISSISVDEIKNGEQIISIKTDTLTSLEEREVLKGDSDIKDDLVAKYAYPYNSRLNLAGVMTVPVFYPLESYFAFNNGRLDTVTNKGVVETYNYNAYIFIEAEKEQVIVKSKSNILMKLDEYNKFFFFPNVKAKELIVERIDNRGLKSYSHTYLKEHSSLNGVYGYINTNFDNYVDASIFTKTDVGIPYPNKIYTSEVNNPFTFPANLVCSVGSGEIIGISSAAKALSEGQYGQFPLYAFTSEGIWALEVSNTGTYFARQPITRDVVIHQKSITQIDSAVLSATDRGIMLLSGSTSTCISDTINNMEEFSIASIPKGDEVLKLSELNLNEIIIIPFSSFIKKSQMLYDYPHQRIIVFNPEYKYAYVYSMKSKQWGMMRSNIAYGVNSYPEALAMDNNGNLVNLSLESSDKTKGLLITRPFKINEPNIFKTISTIIQRGNFIKSHINQILYASNDLENWHVVWSSSDAIMRGFRGTPYKYFRLALICNLDKSESIYGCSIQYEPRLLNKLR